MTNEVEQAFEELKDPAAISFCRCIYAFFHALDDVWDKDKPLDPQDLIIKVLALFDTLSINPFWQTYRRDLMPVISASAFAWAASERLRTDDDPAQKIAAEFIKSQYMDIFFQVALVLHGPFFAAKFDISFRRYYPN